MTVFKQANIKEEIEDLKSELSNFNNDEFIDYEFTPYLGDYYFLKDVPDNEIKNDLMAVDKFIKTKINDDHLDMNKESYERIIKEIEEAVGVKEGEQNWSRLQKIKKYADAYFTVKNKIEKMSRNLNKGVKIDDLEVLLEALMKIK